MKPNLPEINRKKYDFHTPEHYTYKAKRGLNEEVIREISRINKEPEWMLRTRLKAYEHFKKRPLPRWGLNLEEIEFDKVIYYVRPTEKKAANWEELPREIKETFDKLGIPEAEREFLAGVEAQLESESVYGRLKETFRRKGIIFTDMNTAVREYEDIVREYFGKIVPYTDNKFAALNTAVWSGGTFLYVPKGVVLELPVQAYFRINAEEVGQFERTLIIVEEGGAVHYIEGCTAPMYSKGSLHAAVVEVYAKKNAKVRYTTIQNWSKNVYNLATKRAIAEENATVSWVDGNLGSGKTMKYPMVILKGDHAKAELLSIAFATKNQELEAGGKILHIGSNTSSRIISKSISKDGGLSSYRGLIKVVEGSKNSQSHVVCDALLLGKGSRAYTYPYTESSEKTALLTHEAKTGRIGEEQLLYLMSRGLSEEDATAVIILGFLSEITKEIPAEYSIELNQLIKLEMEGSVG